MLSRALSAERLQPDTVGAQPEESGACWMVHTVFEGRSCCRLRNCCTCHMAAVWHRYT